MRKERENKTGIDRRMDRYRDKEKEIGGKERKGLAKKKKSGGDINDGTKVR